MSAALPILYGNRESGHSYKVRQTLVLLGMTHEYRYVDLLPPRAERRADFVAVSPYGEVPVFIDEGGVLAQSNAILLHLVRKSGRLGGGADLERTTQWLFWEANRNGFSLANLRFALRFAKEDPGVVAMLRRRTEADLDRLAQEFDCRPYLLGEAPSVADISCAGYLFFADQAEIDLGRWSSVGAWLDRLAATPGWSHPYELMDARQATAL
ncbi:MAG: glutathione S-transferase family protein [Reyranella sp.]|nr:glutathione S-transferase family protein [Reyranella sp.]